MKDEINTSQQDQNTFIKKRKKRESKLNLFVEVYYKNIIDEKSLSTELFNRFEVFESDKKILATIIFLLESFQLNENLLYRKDGKTLLVTHSLELYFKAIDFGIKDSRIHHLLLLHDVVEDTSKTLEDIEIFDRSNGIDSRRFVSILTEDKSKRTEFGRDGSVALFVRQIVEARDLKNEEKTIVVIAEIIDRIDDLSDSQYIWENMDSEDNNKYEQSREKLVKKLAKCKYVVENCTKNISDTKTLELKRIFFDIVAYYLEKYSITELELEKIIEYAYKK